MPDLSRRVAAVALVSVLGIALAAQLTFANEPSDAPRIKALIDAADAPSVIAARAGLSQRDILAVGRIARPERVPVEQLDAATLPRPETAAMEATLFVVPTPPPTPTPPTAPAPVAAPALVAAAPFAAAPAAPAPPVSTAPVGPFVLDAAVWDRLAQCESSGNWSINTGNGYYGGLQFSLSTWLAYGGGEFAPYPHQATREQQITVAERLYAARGFQPWPACREKLGLP